MAFCSACGAEVSGAAFCPKCGAAQGGAAHGSVATTTSSTASPTAGMEENVAGLLSYILGWITGLIFFLIDKRPFVRFHAAQSILLNIALFVVYFAIAIGFGVFRMIGLGFFTLFIWPLIGLAAFILWVFLMYKAYQHEKFMLPVIGGIAEGMANK
jgi:uncharacterized membrane protein